MKEIKLTQGKVALVDDDDFEFLMQWNWYAQKGANTYYACASDYSVRKNKKLKMHRVIINAPDGLWVDHKNGNGLDNRRDNLRLATRIQNLQNRGAVKGNYCGVSLHKRDKVWYAYITVNKKRMHLGYFEKEVDAAIAYDIAAEKYFGEFAKLNFPKDGE